MAAENLNKVLIIDDDPVTTSVISERLKRKGFETSSLNDPKNYEDAFNSVTPDLVLLDLNMPYLNGFEILKKIRQKYKRNELPVIIITSSDSKNDLVNALDEGANDFISKPINYKVIGAKIRNHLDNRLQNDLEKREKELAAIRSMVTTLNHEINNPLAIAYATLHSLNKKYPNDPDVEKLKGSLKRIEEFVLAVEKISRGKKINYKDYAGLDQLINLDDDQS